jgi:hypothetical protein
MERSHATVGSRSGKFETLEAASPAKVASRVKSTGCYRCDANDDQAEWLIVVVATLAKKCSRMPTALARRRLAAASTGGLQHE